MYDPFYLPQEEAEDVPPVRSTRHRAVGRAKRKAEAEPVVPPLQEAERQVKLERALLQQLEMQKKLHEQLEVRQQSFGAHAGRGAHAGCRVSGS